MPARIPLVLIVSGLVWSSCVGIQAGALYDYRERRPELVLGIFVEGYGDKLGTFGGDRTSYGARASTLISTQSPTRVSLQPEVNLPLRTQSTWNVTLAAGPAIRPWAVQTSACVRDLGAGTYGTCTHWLSDGKAGATIDVSAAAMLLFMNLGSIH